MKIQLGLLLVYNYSGLDCVVRLLAQSTGNERAGDFVTKLMKPVATRSHARRL